MVEIENIDIIGQNSKAKRLKIETLGFENKENETLDKSASEVEHTYKLDIGNNKIELEQDDSDDNKFVIELNRYWPYGTDLDEPIDLKRLYLFSENLYTNDCCAFTCIHNIQKKKAFLLKPMYQYRCINSKNDLFIVEIDEHPQALQKLKIENQLINWYVEVVLKCTGCLSSYGKSFIMTSKHIQYYYSKETKKIVSYILLDSDDPNFSLEFSETDETIFCSRMKSLYLKGKLDYLKIENDTNQKIIDSSDFPEVNHPENFKLVLRSDQLRTINWMMTIESAKDVDSNTILHNYSGNEKTSEPFLKIKLGNFPYYLSLSGLPFKDKNIETFSRFKSVDLPQPLSVPIVPFLTNSPITVKPQPSLHLNGGILADDTGSGKTITTLGLIQSNPFNSEKETERRNKNNDLSKFVESRASCIICPANIQKQWINEAKKCNPKFKILGLASIRDHQKYSWNDFIEADIVVLSRNFLKNLNYKLAVEKRRNLYRDLEVNNYIKKSETGRIILELIHFYRVIIDEIHEINDYNSEFKNLIKNIRGDYIWGLTGTPNLASGRFYDWIDSDLSYLDLSNRMKEVIIHNNNAKNEFITKIAKRNVPDLKLPPISTEIIWIDLRPNERILHEWKSERADMRTKLMICSHYQLSDKAESSGVQVQFMTIDQVQETMSKTKKKELKNMELEISFEKNQLNELQNDTENIDIKEIESKEKRIEKLESKFKVSIGNYNYFQSVFKAMSDKSESEECRICFDSIQKGNLTILPCSHTFCYDCVLSHYEKRSNCPLCSHPLANKLEMLRIQQHAVLPEKYQSVDESKYSSKMIAVYQYICDLLESDSEACIILFLQYKELARLISSALNSLGMDHVRVRGNVFQRQNSIAEFMEHKSVRLIMLSSEDSVSGINLTRATHVILMHPFWSGQNEQTDLACEKQGISRAYRFGLKHPLKVVRFAVRGTVEEEITLRRQILKL